MIVIGLPTEEHMSMVVIRRTNTSLNAEKNMIIRKTKKVHRRTRKTKSN